ncbi:MAG TPA: DNA polymerase III subunit gamma/tau, partial [Acidimicrobiales bacterium]|nr:DNA polymerase III subunit gamma/tau [Acidimicrobiales bacterium]
LRNAVRQGRVGHAYLLSGPRGTGKTSSARILAKALNCEAPVDGEPCGRCESCRAIVAGTSFDVHELDAASSNGVEAMRDLVARASLATPGRWKVYIVDEVHMLSTAASNALLKTLEEPPGHVVFVLATTEPQKVLATIRSRTQHFEFHLLDDEVMGGLLADVASEAGLELPEGTIGVVSRRAKGSARDALSALDQVAVAGVLDDDSDELAGIVAGIAAQDVAAALGAIDAAVRAGRDPEQVAVELVDRLRIGFLALVAPAIPLGGVGAKEREEAEALGTARLVRAMELLGAALVAMRDAPEPRITLELAVIRCTLPEADDSPAALVERLERLERRVGELAAGGPIESGSFHPAPTPNPGRLASSQVVPPSAPTSQRAGAAAGAHPAAVERADPSRAASAGADPPRAPSAGVDPPGAEPASAGGPDGGPESGQQGSSRSGRRALGSYRRRSSGESGSPGPGEASSSGREADLAGESESPRQVGDEPGSLFAAGALSPDASFDAPPSAHPPPPPQPAPPHAGEPDRPPATGTEAAPAPPGAGPSRDELVAAWGDAVLPKLPIKLRAYYAAGRFVSAEPGEGGSSAVFAVPNAAHVLKAEPLRREVERALSDHFGMPISLRLVPDDDPQPGPPSGTAGAGAGDLEPDLDSDVADLLEAEPLSGRDLPPSGVAWAEGRLLEAFPGAEEI